MSKYKVLVTGAKGQLGSDIVTIFTKAGYEVIGLGRDQLNIVDENAVQDLFLQTRPDIVIHSAAYTKVDLAESESDLAFLVNAIGTRNVAIAADNIGAKLVYISTDYVFNGTANEPYNEFTATSPIGIYGKSKLAGEKFVENFNKKYFIVRTSWVFGENGNNFVKTMINLAKSNKEISVVNDQCGCPTYTIDLAECILRLVETSKYGVYHVSNSDSCTWYDFAKEIFRELDLNVVVKPISTSEFKRPAPRPNYSVFDHMSLRLNGFPKMRNWKVALKEFLKGE